MYLQLVSPRPAEGRIKEQTWGPDSADNLTNNDANASNKTWRKKVYTCLPLIHLWPHKIT